MTINTTAEVKYAGFWRRAVAYFIDALILWLIIMLPEYFIVKATLGYSIFRPTDVETNYALGIFNSIAYSLLIAYFLSGKWQASPGKRLMNCHVVQITAQSFDRLSLKTAFFRQFSFCLATLIPLGLFMLLYTEEYENMLITSSEMKEKIDWETHGLFAVVSYIPMIIWFAPIIFTGEKTALHDIIFKTRVIKGRILTS